MTRDQLILRMTEAKLRLIERGMVPRSIYLMPTDYRTFNRQHFDWVPVYKSTANFIKKSRMYGKCGRHVIIPKELR